jgi:hypothetical protein
MPVKFNHYWTVNQEKSKEYEKFVLRKFINGLNKLGTHVVAGWSVLIGGYSEIIFETIADDLHQLEKALRNTKYKDLTAELQNYVINYKTKVLTSTGQKEAYTTKIEKNTVKFTQMWDVITSKKDDYKSYVTGSFYPCMERLGISVASEWEVLIGEGPRIICEGRAHEINTVTLVSNLQSEEFLKARQGLKKFVEKYESRILIFHIRKIKGYKTASYEMKIA